MEILRTRVTLRKTHFLHQDRMVIRTNEVAVINRITTRSDNQITEVGRITIANPLVRETNSTRTVRMGFRIDQMATGLITTPDHRSETNNRCHQDQRLISLLGDEKAEQCAENAAEPTISVRNAKVRHHQFHLW